MRLTLTALSFPTFLILGAACTGASGDVRGGEMRFDASAPEPLVAPSDEPTFADAPATSWKGIYRDFFGRRARGSCAGNGTCHDAEGKPGSAASNFICGDVDGCYRSLMNAKDPDPRVSVHALVEQADISTPDTAYLFKVLRFRAPDGSLVSNRNMPQLPQDFAYAASDVDRMKAWIRAGAKNE